jgi:hypothetical protein
MADRLDYYFRQRVSEAELDLAFELLEKADRNLAADIGVFGVISGAEPTPHSPIADLTIDLTAPARAYDRLGQRIFFGTGQRVDCSVDDSGIPTEITVAGKERWLGVFLRFDRLLSDPRTDGNSQQVYFRRDETFELVVRQGPEANVGTAPKVPLQEDELLICDVLRRHGQTQIISGDLDASRRQAFIFATGDAVQIVSGLWTALAPAVETVQAALDSADALLAGHFAGTTNKHSAANINSTPHGFVAATNVQAALDELVDDLSSAAAGTPGALRVGADAVAGAPNALPAGNVDGQLSQLLAWLNAHVGAITGAHNASAVAATAHNNIGGINVQSQLQEIVTDLAATAAGSAGGTLVGVDAVAGAPNALAAGTVRSQLSQLLGFVNVLPRTNAPNTWTATQELDGPAGEENPSITTVINPTNRKLLWAATGGTYGLRLYYTDRTIEITLNARWDGTQWVKDSTAWFSARFVSNNFEVRWQLHADAASPFAEAAWSGSVSRQFVFDLDGIGDGQTLTLGREYDVPSGPLTGYSATEGEWGSTNANIGGGASFASGRLPAAPSSVTFTVHSQFNTDNSPSAFVSQRMGVGWFDGTTGGLPSTRWMFLSFSAT